MSISSPKKHNNIRCTVSADSKMVARNRPLSDVRKHLATKDRDASVLWTKFPSIATGNQGILKRCTKFGLIES